ncbi:MAG TPA: hypothetical protein VF146_11585, partial [Bryobacteraceae bacterium]
MTNNFAIRLWNLTKRGTRVIIARDDVRPLEISNARFFVSKLKAVSDSEVSQVAAIARDGILAAAKDGPLTSSGEVQDARGTQGGNSASHQTVILTWSQHSCPSSRR